MERLRLFAFGLFMAFGSLVMVSMFYRVLPAYGIFMGIFLVPVALYCLYVAVTGKEP